MFYIKVLLPLVLGMFAVVTETERTTFRIIFPQLRSVFVDLKKKNDPDTFRVKKCEIYDRFSTLFLISRVWYAIIRTINAVNQCCERPTYQPNYATFSETRALLLKLGNACHPRFPRRDSALLLPAAGSVYFFPSIKALGKKRKTPEIYSGDV